jgi:multicomponent Na+:H+ antiporter subunit A
MLFGAPDLAMTQIVVEALTVLLFVLAFPGLPPFRELSEPGTRLRDGILAVSVGGMMTLLLLLATGFGRQPTVSSYFAEVSYLEAHGRNVVNVILVDFRALDTLGEVTVLATAATGVYTLIRLVLPREVRE